VTVLTREDVERRVVVSERANVKANFFDEDMSGADLSGMSLVGAQLNCVNLSGANLIGVDLTGAKLFRADMSGANLAGANLTSANLANATLEGANVEGATLVDINAYFVNFRQVDMSTVNLTDARLIGARFPDSLLVNESVTGEQLAKANQRIGPTPVTAERWTIMRTAALSDDGEQLRQCARSRLVGVRMITASNVACPEDVLLRLAADARSEVRVRVTSNPSCPPSIAAIAALHG